MTVRRAAGSFLVAAAFVSSWNAVQVYGVQPVDLFIAAAFALSAFYLAGGRVPWIPSWAKWGSASVLIVLVIHLLFPTAASFMTQRYIYLAWYIRVGGLDPFETGTFNAVKWLLAMTLVPVLVVDASRRNPAIVKRIANAWMLGAAVSAFIAVTDFLGITDINHLLIYIGMATARQAGLAAHPNHLAMATAMVVPLAVGVTMNSRWKGLPLVIVLMLGEIVSGSRAGQAGFILGVAGTVAFSHRARRFAPILIVVAGIALSSVVWINPGIVDRAATLFRFSGGDQYLAKANEERGDAFGQAIRDFQYRPIDGVGLEVVNQAHSIYLQLIASGGLILTAGMFIYFVGVLRAGFAERRSPDPVGVYLLLCVCVWLAAGAFGTQLTDRYLYFPVAGLAALQFHRMRQSRERRRVLREMAIARAIELEQRAALSA